MLKLNLLREDCSYTFRSYFEMSYEPDDILAEFGYTFSRAALALPEANYPHSNLVELRRRLETHLSLASLSSEAARREVLVAPILLEAAALSH
ncbi:MAG: hypothetical protein F6J97_24375, partial [Leptolyngbya sp. SIO4C1]|nr:hypothetical protein [Leptolyngbya sp. SIO4C1]